MTGYTFRGSNYSIFIFTSLLDGGQLFKERICFSRSKFFPSRVDHFLKGFPLKLSPFVKMAEKKHGSVSIHLKILNTNYLASTHYLYNHSDQMDEQSDLTISCPHYCMAPCPNIINLFTCSTQLSMKFCQLINSKLLVSTVAFLLS